MRNLVRNPKLWLLLILVVAAILRFYRLSEYLQFLGDEGRDVLIVKRMIVDHIWTLLGPTASVGGFYIGGLYYYFMLPFLWLFKLDPVGPAVMSALFGLAAVYFAYHFCKYFFNEQIGLLCAFLIAISPKMIYISRFSWNPNPTPVFAFLTIFFLYLSTRNRRILMCFLCGVSLGILQEFHYTNLIMGPIIGLSMLLIFPIRQAIINLIFVGLGFLLGNSPYLVFEIRHNFPNIRSVLEFTTRGHGAVISPRSLNLVWLFNDMVRRTYETVFGFKGLILDTIYLLSLIGYLAWAIKSFGNKVSRPKVILLTVWLVVGAIGIGSYQGQLLDHYFTFLYPVPFILVALTLGQIFQHRLGKIIAPLALITLLVLEIKNMYFWQPPNNLVRQTKEVDKIVLTMTQERPYNFALITPGNSDHAYRYFLEVWGKPPTTIENPDVDPQRKTVSDQLITVCEGTLGCKPLGNPLWEVAGFGRGEIVEQKIGPAGIIVYKLVHYKGN